MEKDDIEMPKEELDISNFNQMYYANCRERESFGQPILSREEYEKEWRQLILTEKNKNG